jgi:hypothetical protein
MFCCVFAVFYSTVTFDRVLVGLLCVCAATSIEGQQSGRHLCYAFVLFPFERGTEEWSFLWAELLADEIFIILFSNLDGYWTRIDEFLLGHRRILGIHCFVSN